jgi:immune inhibitor A
MRTDHNPVVRRPAGLMALLALLAALAMTACTTGPSSGVETPTAAPPPATSAPLAQPVPASVQLTPSLPLPDLATSIPTPTGDRVPGLPSQLPHEQDQAATPPATFSPDYPFPAPPERDLYRLAAQLSPNAGDLDMFRGTVAGPPDGYSPGLEAPFWLVDFRSMTMYQAVFELRLVTPSAYWWVEKGQPVLPQDLDQAGWEFEERIFPRVTAAFGSPWPVEGESRGRLNIVHAGLQGAIAGYYSSGDEHPRQVYPYSNEGKTIYIRSNLIRPGRLPTQQSYLEVLAHELQHAIHWRGNSSEDTWVNEGLSELAVTVAGYGGNNIPPASIRRFLRTPTVSLIHWPLDNSNISAHYGGASLFMHYLAEHYSRDNDLRDLVQERSDGIAGIDAYLHRQGYGITFREVFRDWVVANILDEQPGRYGYSQFKVDASIGRAMDRFSQESSTIPQYAAEYVQLRSLTGPVRIRFQGAAENRLLPVDLGEHGCWWSNSGDSISSTLTRSVDLQGREQATLSYQVWHNVEQNWDYGYIQVSEDGGQTWQILETPHTSPENPIGNSFGPGYTGDSHGWLSEEIDLSPYSGSQVEVRFHYVTDDAVNGAGLCFRNIALSPGHALDGDDQWRAEGFVHIDNVVQQDYIVQVIQIGERGRVSTIALDAANRGELVIFNPEKLDRLVVAVAALAPKTLQRAPYTLTVEPAD